MSTGGGPRPEQEGTGGSHLPTLCLIRHAKAASRSRWTGDDHERPLTERGRQQATILADYIPAKVGRPSRILSSPAARCRQTVAPLAEGCGLDTVEVAWLDEGWTPDDAFERLRTLTLELDGGAGGPVAASTHGDIMWGILELLVTSGVDLGETADAPKGGLWILGFRTKAPPTASFFLPLTDS